MIDKIMRPNRVYSACCITAYIQHYMPASTKVATRYPPIKESLELQLAFSGELRIFIVNSSLKSIVFAELIRFTLYHHGEVHANFTGWFTFFRRP